MSETVSACETPSSESGYPVPLPLTVEQYATLVDKGSFDQLSGQIELFRGEIVRMNPQGPQHSHPIDLITEWSIRRSAEQFLVRCEKPIELPEQNSTPEPDVAWVTRRTYHNRHPGPKDIQLLTEVSFSSAVYDREQKRGLYAEAGIPEYWRFDVPTKSVERFREPNDGDYQNVVVIDVAGTISPLCLPSTTLNVASVFSSD